MLDDVLREQFAEWARPVAQLPIPDIRVLRRRARRRGIRKAVTAAVVAAAVTAAAVAVGVGVGVGLPGKGRPAGGRPAGGAPSWPTAPGSWTHGVWRPAGSLPAADAGPAGQPFIVLIVPGRGTAQVRNVFTFKTVATVQPPEGQHLAGVAAAGDDRTFVVEAQVGGQEAAGKFKPSYAAFDELRLSADGQPESLRLLFTIAAKPGLPGFTISQDASMLAYSTNNNGFETVSLATGTGRSWPAVDGGDGVAMSWAGDRALAFEWTNTTLATGPPGGTTHPPGVGLRVLDVTAPGTLVQASRLVVSYGRYCAASGACQGGQLMTPDGTKVLITKVVTRGQGYTDNVLEYSARTGQALASVVPVVNTPYAGPPCVPLWTDPSGEQVVSFCGGHGEQFDQGHVSRVTLHLPMYGLNFGASFAW